MGKIIIVIIGLLIVGGIYAYANYNITVDEQKFEQMLPLKMVEQKFDELYETIPTESIQSTFQDFADSIPIKIEEKTSTPESKFIDCSKYKREYLESYKNVKTTEDSMAAMIGDSLAGVQKTRACEQYNAEIKKQYGELGIDTTKMVCPDGDGYSICELTKKYPTGGPAIRAAVDSGQLNYDKLPKEFQKKYNDTPAPYILKHDQISDEKKLTDAEQEEEYEKSRAEFDRLLRIRCQNITQKDLSSCDLHGFSMHDRDFSYANLSGANLYHVDLSRSNFTGANLDGAYIAGAVLTDTIFTGCIGTPYGEPIGGTRQICTPLQ